MPGGIADELQTDRGATGLGRCRVDGTHAHVVHVRHASVVDLSRGVRREADQQVRADKFSHLCDRRVLLTHVHPVGAGRQRHLWAIVDDQQCPHLRADHVSGARHFRELPVGEVLITQLHDVHAARDRRTQDAGQLPAAGFGIADHV